PHGRARPRRARQGRSGERARATRARARTGTGGGSAWRDCDARRRTEKGAPADSTLTAGCARTERIGGFKPCRSLALERKPMSIASDLIRDIEAEAKKTRTLLAVVPEQKFAWKPHAKSMTLGALASHVAENPSWISAMLE